MKRRKESMHCTYIFLLCEMYLTCNLPAYDKYGYRIHLSDKHLRWPVLYGYTLTKDIEVPENATLYITRCYM